MSTLRDSIHERIIELQDSTGPVVYAFDNPDDAADDIVAMVRKALLSDRAVNAACQQAYSAGPGETSHVWADFEMAAMRQELTVAMDAVFGDDAE